MDKTTKFIIILFAVMFFWVYSVEAFGQTMTCQTSSAGITTCTTSEGKIIVIQGGRIG